MKKQTENELLEISKELSERNEVSLIRRGLKIAENIDIDCTSINGLEYQRGFRKAIKQYKEQIQIESEILKP